MQALFICCTELKSVQFWFIFWPNFGYHGNSLGSLENSGSIFEFANSVYLTIYEKNCLLDFFAQNCNVCYFGWFSSKFGCHCNSFSSLEISDSIFNFADPENLTIRVKKFSIDFFCAELKSVQLLLIFAQIWLPWKLLGSLEILDNMFEIADPEKKLCRYLVHKWRYAYSNVWRIFTIAVIGFLYFFARNSGNCFNILIISQKCTRVRGSTSDEPLTTFLP